MCSMMRRRTSRCLVERVVATDHVPRRPSPRQAIGTSRNASAKVFILGSILGTIAARRPSGAGGRGRVWEGLGLMTRDSRFLRLVVSAVMSGWAAIAGGCGSGLEAHDIRLSLSEELRSAPSVPDLTVDVIGVPPAEAEVLLARPVRAHFSAGDAARARLEARGALKSFAFGPNDLGDKVITASDSSWDGAWMDAESIYVLANLPGATASGAGDENRRVEIPRRSARWPEGTEEVTVVIGEQQLRLRPEPRAAGE